MPRRTRLYLYDATQTGSREQFLSLFWELWGDIGGFDYVVPVYDADDIPAAVHAAVPGRAVVDHWQLACHGSSGAPAINGKRITPQHFVAAFHGYTHAVSSGWIRSCDSFRGEDGHEFAKMLVGGLRHTVYGHTRIVSQARAGRTYGDSWRGRLRAQADLALAIAAGVLYQSGCYGLQHGAEPHWSVDDKGYSGPDEPNTAFLTQRRPRKEWAR